MWIKIFNILFPKYIYLHFIFIIILIDILNIFKFLF